MSGFITGFDAADALVGGELLEVSQPSSVVAITATTISVAAADNSINDSGNGFVTAGFAAGDRVVVEGFGTAGNNLLVGTLETVAPGKLVIAAPEGDALANEAAGAAVTISKWTTRRVTAQDIADLTPTGGGGGGGGGGSAGSPNASQLDQVKAFTATNYVEVTGLDGVNYDYEFTLEANAVSAPTGVYARMRFGNAGSPPTWATPVFQNHSGAVTGVASGQYGQVAYNGSGGEGAVMLSRVRLTSMDGLFTAHYNWGVRESRGVIASGFGPVSAVGVEFTAGTWTGKLRVWRIPKTLSGAGGTAGPILLSETIVGASGLAEIVETIPAGYGDLKIVGSARSTAGGLDTTLNARFNGDAGANYGSDRESWFGRPRTSSANLVAMAPVTASGAVAGAAGGFDATIPAYGSTLHKTLTCLSIWPADGTPSYQIAGAIWRNTAPINSIRLWMDSGSFAEGSVIRIYGTKAP